MSMRKSRSIETVEVHKKNNLFMVITRVGTTVHTRDEVKPIKVICPGVKITSIIMHQTSIGLAMTETLTKDQTKKPTVGFLT